MPKIFDREQVRKPKMSAFDLSREQKLSCEMGTLVPTYLEEVVPGDQFQVNSEIMMRLAPMISPVMHRVNVYMHYFFVPNRLTWNQWEDFITGGKDGTTEPTFPAVSLRDVQETKLHDYLGLPTIPDTAAAADAVSELPFRAYQLIWNEYYRDETLQDEIDIHALTDTELQTLRKRCWEKDYFTSALPFTQRGPEVTAPVRPWDEARVFQSTSGDKPTIPDTIGQITDQGDYTGIRSDTNDQTLGLDTVEGIDINDLRRSTALQRWLEKQARGGYRYIETILNHFAQRVPDHRLQRPEYLGGGRQPVVISEVLNTTGTTEAPQGDMAGHGISVGNKNRFRHTFQEHGYVLGIMSTIPRTAYQQGMMRHWLRRDKESYYWPEFAHLGEQPVRNKELFMDPAAATWNDEIFGYQQRYAEYKYGCSSVHGDFRDSLDFWHMGRIFSGQPALNETFVQSDPTNRIFAVSSGDHLWIQIFHNVKARRPMPYFSNPRL